VGQPARRVPLEAARRAKAPIRIVGSGPDHAALSEAYSEAEFLGRAFDEYDRPHRLVNAERFSVACFQRRPAEHVGQVAHRAAERYACR